MSTTPLVQRQVTHTTRYQYEVPVDSSYHLAMLKPRLLTDSSLLPQQSLQHFELSIEPPPLILHEHDDAFGNRVHSFEIIHPHRELQVSARSWLNIAEPGLFPMATPAWEVIAEQLHYRVGAPYQDAAAYCFPSPRVPRSDALRSLAASECWPGRPVHELSLAFMQAIHRDFTYRAGVTTVATTVDEVLRLRSGVCQDFAHVMIGALRSLGLAARYVSGYLLTLPPPGQQRLIGADASHAWVSVWLGQEHGWLDLDPTNDQLPDQRYVRVAVGRDYGDVTPLKGIIHGGGTHQLDVSVHVD